jgi:hypothetical protein
MPVRTKHTNSQDALGILPIAAAFAALALSAVSYFF